MKKTDKTALIAAAFAAALNIVPSTASAETTNDPVQEIIDNQEDVYGPPSWFETTTEPADDPVQELFTTIQFVYGPMSTLPENTTTGTTTYDPVKETTEQLSLLYGPPPIDGDVNWDYRIDAFDVVEARKNYVEGKTIENINNSDMNNDGKYTIADLLLLAKSVFSMDKESGFVEENRPATTTQMTFAPLYGPPPSFYTTDDDDDDVITIQTTTSETVTTVATQTLYGPPPAWRE